MQQEQEVLVSIICNAYNHEKYVQSALEGFINQKTNFPFEVLIHDDASLDNTADIIKSFELKYPDIIKPIYEVENQYSKGNGALIGIQYGRAKGKYIAICEGDDYWTDPLKLQKQVDYMETHAECSICISNGLGYDCQSDTFRELFEGKEYEESQKSQIITLDNVAVFQFPPTASYLYRKDIYLNTYKTIPLCTNGDLRSRLLLMTKGYCYYLSDKTCVYRQNVPNSAMAKWKKQSRAQRKKREQSVIDMISGIDKMTNFEHSSGLWEIKQKYIFAKLNSADKLSDLKDKESKKVFQSLPLAKKARILFKIILPDFLWNKLKK